MAPGPPHDRVYTAEEERFIERINELERLRTLSRYMSNTTEEELAYALDPSLPKPPPRETIRGPCECYICNQQFRTTEQQKAYLGMCYTKKLTDDEAIGIAEGDKTSIQELLEHLRAKCTMHGKTIASRWKKKSRDKRDAIMLQADSELEKEQWFLPRYLVKKDALHWETARKHRKTWLLQWLSIDALRSDPARLLGLLNNRARYTPEEWAPHDNENLVFGYNQGFLAINYSALCFVMHGSEYGELVPWEENAAHRLDIIGFPRGQLILEAQETLLVFLCDIVDQLTEGLDDNPNLPLENNLALAQIPKLEFKRSGHLEVWSAYMNQPFSEPPTFDIDEIVSTVRARVNQMGDHIWLMQTDASYFRRVIRTASSAIPMLHNLKIGQDQPAHIQAMEEILVDYSNFSSWRWILEDCENLQNLRNKYRDQIHHGVSLPYEYDVALQSLEMVLSQQLQNAEKLLQYSFPQRSGFRELYEFDYSGIGGKDVRWRLKHGKRMDSFWDGIFFETEPLYWAISNLVEPPKDRIKYDCSIVLAFLDEHLATCSKEERARMDERLYAQLSDYAALDEMWYATRLHRPGSGSKLSTKELIKVSKSRHFRFLRDPESEAQMIKQLEKHGGLIQPLINFLSAYDGPGQGGKRTDPLRLRRFDALQDAMDVFWSKVNNVNIKGMQLHKIAKEDMDAALDYMSARSKLDVVEALASERQKIVDDIEKSWSVPARGLSGKDEAAGRWDSAPEPALQVAEERKKVKRRPGEAQAVSLPQVEKLDIKDEKESPPKALKQQNYTILNGMFNSNPDSTTKMVDWDAFVTAMADAGFSARQSSGSAVIFEPDDWERGWSGKIVFHKPHPVAKIDSIMLRSMGKRMEKWFGWDEETFVVQ